MILDNESKSRKFIWANIVLVLLVFFLNFLGTPYLKYITLFQLVFSYAAVLVLPLEFSICIILTTCFLEGQGRILWQYNVVNRLAFDFLLITAFIKYFFINKEFRSSNIPYIISVPFFLHCAWYSVEIFNLNSLSLLAPLAATKIYIFPFFIFMLFAHCSKMLKEPYLNYLIGTISLLIVLESSLGIYQTVMKENFMLQISEYYRLPMKEEVFTGILFRPFGTTHLPGAIAVYLYLSFSLLFLKIKFSKKYNLFLVLAMALAFTVMLVTQVRSAQIKLVISIIVCLVAMLITSKNKIRGLFNFGAMAIVGAIVSVMVLGNLSESQLQSLNFASAIARWDRIKSVADARSNRVAVNDAFQVVKRKLKDFPIGIGPGVTGAAASVTADLAKNDPIYTKDNFWAFDNLYLSLILEFGYGAIFYLLLIFSIPFFLVTKIIMNFKSLSSFSGRVALISLGNISIILIGNWGAIGLPYNPESFFFWFWSAVGFNSVVKLHIPETDMG